LLANLDIPDLNKNKRGKLMNKLIYLNNEDNTLLEDLEKLKKAANPNEFSVEIKKLASKFPKLAEQIKVALAEMNNPPTLEKEKELKIEEKSKNASMETEKESVLLPKNPQISEKREGKLPIFDESNNNNTPQIKPRKLRKERQTLKGSEKATANKPGASLNINAAEFIPPHLRKINEFPIKLLMFTEAADEFWKEAQKVQFGQIQIEEPEDIVDLLEYFDTNIMDAQAMNGYGTQVINDCDKVLSESKDISQRLNASQTKSKAMQLCEQTIFIYQKAQEIYQFLAKQNPVAQTWCVLRLELLSAGITDPLILDDLGVWFLRDNTCIRLMNLLVSNFTILRPCEGYLKMLKRFESDTQSIFNLKANLPVIEVALDCLNKGWKILFEVTPTEKELHYDVDILAIQGSKYYAIQVKTATPQTFDNQYVKAIEQLGDFKIKEKGELIKVIYLKVSCKHKNFKEQYDKWLNLPLRYKDYLFVIACQEGEFFLYNPDVLMEWGKWLDK
jgi:hypothetical protein